MGIRTISNSQGQPAAATGFQLMFAQNERSKLESAIFSLATSAGLGTRVPFVRLADPSGLVVFETGYPTGLAPSAAADFVLSPQFGQVVSQEGQNSISIGLPFPNMWLPPGWQILFGAQGLAAGDQFSAVSWVAQFTEDNWDRGRMEAAELAVLATLNS